MNLRMKIGRKLESRPWNFVWNLDLGPRICEELKCRSQNLQANEIWGAGLDGNSDLKPTPRLGTWIWGPGLVENLDVGPITKDHDSAGTWSWGLGLAANLHLNRRVGLEIGSGCQASLI